MKPAPFRYHRASSVRDALAVMSGHEDAAFLAGGQSLTPMLNLRLARPSMLIDLNDCVDLTGIAERDGGLFVGAMTRHHDLAEHVGVRALCPVLAKAAGSIGYYAIRQRGTLGGSLAHADPAAQLPLIATLLGAEIHVEGGAGARTIAAADFFLSVFTTARAPDEIITGVHFPCPVPQQGWAFTQICKVAGDFALASAAATLALSGDGSIAAIRLAIGAVCDAPLLIDASTLMGTRPGPADCTAFAIHAVAELPIEGNGHLSADYRRDATAAMIEQALNSALLRAGCTP